MDMTTREARIIKEKKEFTKLITQLRGRLSDMPLAEGVDGNSWLYAGCRQNIDQMDTRIITYIERCLK